MRYPLLVSIVWLVACVADDASPMSNDDSASTTSDVPAECSSFTTMESCPAPCSWRTFTTYADAAMSCDPGDDVSLCVYESGDAAAGCGVVEGCEEPWGYVEVADGTLAMAAYCGGTPPEAWTACGPDDVEGGIAECACACPGGGESTGTGEGSTSSG